MATIKVFALGGLDKKSNDLIRPTEKASEMLNMEYDDQTTLKKRNGFELFSSTACDDLIYYAAKDEYLAFQNGSSTVTVISGDGATTRTLSLPSGIGTLSDVSISSCENQNNLYFTNTDLTTYVMKYDGDSLYRAGLPTPRVADASKIDAKPSFTGSVPGFFTRIFYSYKDINGNVTYSPYIQLTGGINPGASELTVGTMAYDANFVENGFFNKYCFRSSTSAATLSSASPTLATTKHNYVAGDKFLIDTENKAISISPSNKTFLVLEVESVVANTSITFTADSIGAYTISFLNLSATYATEYPVDIRCKVHLSVSSSSEVGYNDIPFFLDNSTSTMVRALPVGDYVINSGRPQSIPLSSFYDSSTSKIMPPICKYIASYGNQIVYGFIQSFFTAYSASVAAAPNQRAQYKNNDLIVYSDISEGDGPEGVSELNLVKIGETWDGVITGIRRCNDSVVVFKDRGVFTIDGSLIDGEFQLRKINTNFAGCTSHKSILEAEEGVYFQAHNGIYFTNGIGVRKLTSEVDSVFISGEYLSTRAARLKKKQKSLFYVPELSKIVVIDYDYNQLYFWDSINAVSGMVENASGDVLFSNGTNIYKFNDGYSDNGVGISALYATTWHHATYPSLNKKFLSVRLFALSNDAFDLTMTTQGDWNTTNLTTNTVNFAANDQTKFIMLDMQTKRSLRLLFSNNTNNQNMVITGYEISVEMFNNVDKN